jgi:hypothetical protein
MLRKEIEIHGKYFDGPMSLAEISEAEKRMKADPEYQRARGEYSRARGKLNRLEADRDRAFIEGELPSRLPARGDRKRVPGDSKIFTADGGIVHVRPIARKAKKTSARTALFSIVPGDKDVARPELKGIWHEAGSGVDVASSGHVMLVIPATNEKTWIEGRDGAEIKGKIPEWKNVIPGEAGARVEVKNIQPLVDKLAGATRASKFFANDFAVRIEAGGKPYFFNAGMLSDAVDAMQRTGSDEFLFEFGERQTDAVIIRDAKNSNKLALVMPRKPILENREGILIVPVELEGEVPPPTPSKVPDSTPLGGESTEETELTAEERVKEAEKEVDENPTEGQKKAGNYQKGHVRLHGFDISIENPRGSTRSGVDENGKPWKTKMRHAYGYIRGTEGKDHDHVDVFIGNHPSLEKVYIVDQLNPSTGKFDEHKVMLGFGSIEEAYKAYLSNYSEDWEGFGDITGASVEEFRDWVMMEGRRVKPFADYRRALGKVDRLQSVEDLEAANDRFDGELDRFEKGELKPHEVLHMGAPLGILQASGVKEGEITVTQKTLKTHMEKHGLSVGDLKGLAGAIQKPILVYNWGKKNPSTMIVTEITVADGRKIAVGIRLDHKGNDLTVNEIATIHGKTVNHLLEDWAKSTPEELAKEKLKWVEKEKVLDWLDVAPPKGAMQANEGLNWITKVVQEFENPKLPGEKMQSGNKRMSRVSPEGWARLIDLLKKTGLAREVIADEDKMLEYLEKRLGDDVADRFMTLWHGTGANFDRFKKEFMLSGEGNMAYGPGFYFTEIEDIAKSYARSNVDLDALKYRIDNRIDHWERKDKKTGFAERSNAKPGAAGWRAVKMTDEEYEKAKTEYENNRRLLLKVKIHGNKTADKLNFVRWDKEISKEQKAAIIDKIKSLPDYNEETDEGVDPGDKKAVIDAIQKGMTGREIQGTLEVILGRDENAKFMQFMLSCGIDGIQYPTEFHDKGGREDSFNYVVFDEKAIEIVDKIRLMFTPEGEVYGFVTGEGDVYLDPELMNANTPIHEFGHLFWGVTPAGMKERITSLLKKTPGWDKLSSNPAYNGLETDEEKADELFNALLGDYGEFTPRVREIVGDDVTLYARVVHALNEFLTWLKALFGNTEARLDRFAKQTLNELLSGEAVSRSDKQGSGVHFSVRQNPRLYLTNARGGWTKDKILRELKNAKKRGTNDSTDVLVKYIAQFNSPRELREHLFYHGTGSRVSSEGLYPSITMSEREAGQRGGGGYGERYWAISVTRSKRVAQNFSGNSSSVSIYPVLLNKEAKVIDMPGIQDSSELEDKIEQLWNDGVDAVRIGNWNDPDSEQELAVINPHAISAANEFSERHAVYRMKRLDDLTDEQLQDLINNARKVFLATDNFKKENPIVFPERPGMTPMERLEDTRRIRREYEKKTSEIRDEIMRENPIRFQAEESEAERVARNAIMPREARSVSEAQELVRPLVGKPITNEKLGITATISGNSLGKLGSQSATEKSVSPALHAKAVANIDVLFERAEFDVTHPDERSVHEVEKVHRLGSLMFDETSGEYVPVMITVKEFNNPKGNRIYTVEAVDIESKKSAGQLVVDRQSPLQQTPIADFDAKVRQLVELANSARKNSSGVRFQIVESESKEEESERDKEVRLLREELRAKLSSKGFLFREAMQDSLLAVKKFLELLEEKGVKIPDHDNFYMQGTMIPGQVDAAVRAYESAYRAPMLKAISDLQGLGFSYREIENYAMLKHGLERNEYMTIADRRDGKKEQDDYSGVKAIEKEVGMEARACIDAFEARAGSALVDEFWKRVRGATNNAIRLYYHGGMTSKRLYDDVMKRYDYYIPLRGHDGQTAEEMYDYGDDAGIWFSNPMQTAKGRKSRPATPFAYIDSMNMSAARASRGNLVRQSMYRLALRDTTGLMTVSRQWYTKGQPDAEGNETWEARWPAYSEDPDVYARNIEEFEKRMEKWAATGMATSRTGKLDVGGLFIKPKQAEHHAIPVMVNGEERVVYINGDPKVAEAVTFSNMADVNAFLRAVKEGSRFMAANFTTRRPDFVASNAMRDYIYASSALFVKEGAKYTAAFEKNLPLAIKEITAYFNGKGSAIAGEFIMNGGRTGYTSLLELQDVQRRLERDIKRGGKKRRGTISNVLHAPADGAMALLSFIDAANAVAENSCRLAVYMTSKELDRGVIRSIYDAKEVTLNFNRRGTGQFRAKKRLAKMFAKTPAAQ